MKVRDEHGGAIDPEGLLEIEAGIPPRPGGKVKRMPLDEAMARGLVVTFDPAPAYLEQLARMIDVQPIKDAGLTVLVDCMWGNGAGWFPRILGGGRTKIRQIHAARNPLFPGMSRPEPMATNVSPTSLTNTGV